MKGIWVMMSTVQIAHKDYKTKVRTDTNVQRQRVFDLRGKKKNTTSFWPSSIIKTSRQIYISHIISRLELVINQMVVSGNRWATNTHTLVIA